MIKYRKILSFSLGVIILSLTSNAYATGNWINVNNNTGGDLYWSNSGDENDCVTKENTLSEGQSGTIRVDSSEFAKDEMKGVSTALYICQEENTNGDINFIVLNLRYVYGFLVFKCEWDHVLEGLFMNYDKIEIKNSPSTHGCIYYGYINEGTLFINGKEVHTRH